MKKYFIFILIIFTTVVFASDLKFEHALQQCSAYSESGIINTEGMDVYSNKQILGWENGKCIYKETLQMLDTSTCVTCHFTKQQISELVSVMQAYDTVQKYSKTNVDISNLNAIQDNPVVQVWTKYLQDSSVCITNTIK